MGFVKSRVEEGRKKDFLVYLLMVERGRDMESEKNRGIGGEGRI